MEFPLVVLEVLVNAVEFAAKISLLTRADARQVPGQFRQEDSLDAFPPGAKVQSRPVDGLVRALIDLGEVQLLRQVIVQLAIRQSERNPVQGPVLVGGLNFAADRQEQ